MIAIGIVNGSWQRMSESHSDVGGDRLIDREFDKGDGM